MDIYDGDPWTEMDPRDLTAVLKSGDAIEDAAKHLCRSGTVDDVRRKAEELGLSDQESISLLTRSDLRPERVLIFSECYWNG